MRLRTVIGPIITLAAVGGLATLGYATRDRWVPHVFPEKPAAKAKGGHDHEHEHDGHEGHDHEGHDHEHEHADRVKISTQAIANLGLDKVGAVDTLLPREHWRMLAIPGVVADRPGESDRGVTSRVAGVVTEVKARPGDTVRAGRPLFTLQIASEFVQSTQTDLARTSKDLDAAKLKREQTRVLVEAGTRTKIDLITDDNAVKRFTTQVQGYRRQLAVFGLAPRDIDRAERGEAVTEVEVAAPDRPRRGLFGIPVPDDTLYEVQELKVQLGEQVQAGQTLCLLANHQRLFVEGRAFKSEAKALARAAGLGGDPPRPIEAEFADEAPGDWPDPVPPLIIHHLSNQVDPETRMFAFYMPLENQAETFTRDGRTHFVWRFRPGQRVRLKVPVEKLGDDVFVLPPGAVVREGPEAFVFVRSGDVFRRKPVHVLYEDREQVVLANDGSIAPAVDLDGEKLGGDAVVRTPAAAALNRTLKAAAAGAGGGGHEGHNHDH